ncbi:putative Swr1p complex component (Swc5) [Aspergillus glaucus CBS 516.65]|uniref:SWR1-complex protein 5 n=1 Tax=Aspergillus glaucus CBS 516.65 TaxID=1160497 RepID=A0A1L9VVA5_ASPGL|nr:hypothetical protein ASPGLDRAFT_999903 [Aspergillus glaucus CBS 516.65]OJJ87842.1 hypothetical protein ASPGLDRAFT_999903 [Aspergillus glaucus CBS 516.65]
MSAKPEDVDLELGDEPYDSAEDEDFELDAAQDEGSELSSDSEPEPDVAQQPAKKKRKTAPKAKKVTKDGHKEELDSGDEATIQKAKDRKQRKQKGQQAKGKGGGEDEDEEEEEEVDFDDEDEGGTGGFVRTRAMKMRTQEERKPLAKIDGATVDVNALWEKMNATDPSTVALPTHTEKVDDTPAQEEQPPKYPEEMVKIKRTYKFAGEMITEEKVVPKDSAEAKIFLAQGENVDAVTTADVEAAANVKAVLKLRRPLRKVSRFDPNPTGAIKKSWEKHPVAEATEDARGPKINTVEKSRLDWAAYVDQAGIKDELTVHSKAKEGYLGRMDFLDRVDAKKEEERRNVRLRGL